MIKKIQQIIYNQKKKIFYEYWKKIPNRHKKKKVDGRWLAYTIKQYNIILYIMKAHKKVFKSTDLDLQHITRIFLAS